MTRIAALLPHFVYLSSRFPSFWFSSGSCIIAFQVFSAMHFFFFKFNSFHSVNLLLQNASFFAGSSRVLCLLMIFLLYPLIFTVALVFFCLSPLTHFSSIICTVIPFWYRYLSFTIWSLPTYDKDSKYRARSFLNIQKTEKEIYSCCQNSK